MDLIEKKVQNLAHIRGIYSSFFVSYLSHIGWCLSLLNVTIYLYWLSYYWPFVSDIKRRINFLFFISTIVYSISSSIDYRFSICSLVKSFLHTHVVK
jgi:hypothetical protein